MSLPNPLPRFAAALATLLSPLLLCAQDGNPRHPGVAHFERLISYSASDIVPLSDLNGDSISDFALMQGGQAWLYFGEKGRLPELTSGVRIGPTETESVTLIVAVGDWDGMNGPDICTRIELANDTSFGNTEGYQIFRAVIFWNNGNGEFSLNDTTRLSPGVDASFGPRQGTSADLDNDNIEDLVLLRGSGLSGGVIIRYHSLHIFKGRQGQRWGREGNPYTPDWQWWNAPGWTSINDPQHIEAEDLDLDDAIDLTFTRSDQNVAVLYGNPNRLPDTNEVQTLLHGGRAAVFSDVTGDGIQDMNVLNQNDNLIRVFIGCKGQRLLEQFGTGNDPPQGDRPWGKPWAAVKGPNHVSNAWLGLSSALFDLGSADTNSTEEIWVVSTPSLICYDVGGLTIEGVRYGLDSLFDGEIEMRIADAKRVGDVNGDGRDELALTASGEIHFYRTVQQLPPPSPWSWWRVPSCDTSSGVASDELRTTSAFALNVIPNPASSEVRVIWEIREWENRRSGEAVIAVHDVHGQEVITLTVPVYRGEVVWDASTTVSGRYFITVTISDRSETTEVVIQR